MGKLHWQNYGWFIFAFPHKMDFNLQFLFSAHSVHASNEIKNSQTKLTNSTSRDLKKELILSLKYLVIADQEIKQILVRSSFVFSGRVKINILYRWKCFTWTYCAPIGIFSFEISWQLCSMVFEHFSFIIFWIGTFRFAGLFQLSYPPGFDNTSWIKNIMYQEHAAS